MEKLMNRLHQEHLEAYNQRASFELHQISAKPVDLFCEELYKMLERTGQGTPTFSQLVVYARCTVWHQCPAVHSSSIISSHGKPDLAGYILQPHPTRFTLSVNETSDRVFYGSSCDFDDARKNHCRLTGCGWLELFDEHSPES